MIKKKIDKKFFTHKIQMPNNIILLVQEDHSMPTISIAAYFFGGRRIETPENNGITALGQRLMTKGAGEYDAQALAEELEYYGISISPFYGMDTVGLKMKSVSRHFDAGLELFTKILTAPAFTQEEFEKEKSNLLEDIRKEKDEILWYSLKMCEKLVFEGHPYGLASKGTLETVASLTYNQIIEFHKNIYCPHRMIIAFVGDIKAEEAQEKIEKFFSGFNRSGELQEVIDIKGPILNVKEKAEMSEKQQVAICIGFHAPSITSDDFLTFQVLNHVLSGMGSRLFVELRDKMGLAYAVNSNYSAFFNGGIFKAYILAGYSQKDKARSALLEEVDRLRTRLVSYDELVRAKRYHLGLFTVGLQRKIKMASKLAYFELMGKGYGFIDEYPERIKRITRQKVKRAAEKYLKPQCYAVSILNPAAFPKNSQ